MARGKLRMHLGAEPGAGKTYAMLSEAHRPGERGAGCVVAFVDHHHRPHTEVMLHGLEQIARRELEYRDSVLPAWRVVTGTASEASSAEQAGQ